MQTRETIDITPEQKPEQRRRGLTGGLIMVGLGCLFLAKGSGVPVPENWWAFFVLLPAIPYLARAWADFSRGEVSAAFRPFLKAMMFVAISAAFLLNLDWERVWPVFLIFAGV
ncbi:MAG: hypothetical protein ACXWSD_05245, partial [Bdellovibrionota bacterium]